MIKRKAKRNPMLELDVIKEIRTLAKTMVDRDSIALHGSCLYHALAANKVLGAKIVGGSLQWKFTNFDDGENSTHFAYMFEPNKVPIYLSIGVMPEMHIWNVYEKSTLDLTTVYLPAQAMALCGYSWDRSIIPPDYHFGESENAKLTFKYAQHKYATELAQEWANGIELLK